MPKLQKLLLPAAALLLACSAEDGNTDSGAAGSSGDLPGGTAAEATDSVDDTAGETDAPPPASEPARAVSISLVEANSGVAVAIGADGAWVGPEGRNSPIPQGRDTALRVYVDVDDDIWVQRDIEARLYVHLPDGTVETMSLVETIAGDSSTTSFQSGFLFGVIAAWMVPGVEYQVELFEAGTGWEGLPEAAEPPATPAEPGLIGAEDTALEMKVVMVPVDYSFGGCTTSITRDDATLQPYADSIFQQNPLVNLDIQWREPYSVTDLDLSNPGDFFTLLNRAVTLRAQDAPDPNVYYYMLFDNCGNCIGDGGGCTLGVAPGLANDSMGDAGGRAAIGVRYLGGSEVGIETFVHEIGHTQGRAHVQCPGATSAGPDPSYPHENGSIGVWGFGVRDFGVRNPSNHTDYMGYCNPTWVSDWQWNATYDRIRTLSSWDAADMSMPEGQAVLMGMINPDNGETHWWTDRGYITEGTELASDHELTFLAGDEVLNVSQVQVQSWTEGPGITVRAPLPEGYDERVTGIEYRAAHKHYEAPRAAITSYHRPDSLTTGEQ